MRRSKLFVLLTFKDSMVAWLLLSVWWDKEEGSRPESWKAAPPGGGGLIPPLHMIWETLISPGAGIPCQMPKVGGSSNCTFYPYLAKLSGAVEQLNKEIFHRGNGMVHRFPCSRDWKILGVFAKKHHRNVLVSFKYSKALSLVIGEEWILSLWYRAEEENVHPEQGWVPSALMFVSPSNTEVELYVLICPFSHAKDRLGGGLLRAGSEGGKIKEALLFWKTMFFKAV